MKTMLPQDTLLQQYAALPWRVNQEGFLEVLLVTSRRRHRWTVPKGWQVKHRSASQSAETEAFEEAGVIGLIGPQPIGSYLYSKRRDDGSFEPCSVTIFGLYVQAELHTWPERSMRKRRWLSAAAACDVVGEPTLAEFLKTLRQGQRDRAAPETCARHLRQPSAMSAMD
ncbi:NUDIX hydrolase [Mesorhizobium sp. INR15]|uniref:NUDIX hydrolase n=1 Tax=Mesorhizobium sp. INR15 TaxID=2654248 RepID=UPI0018966F9D|nr:NUDIX hydrolase [Mesorhizobium sp. INR15]QPC92978.1 NUDIX hydrolase [Mesorhizobium sp. INR15]